MSKNISRRDFLKGAATGAAGIASMHAAGAFAAEEQGQDMSPQQAAARLNPQDYDYTGNTTDMAMLFSEWKLGPLTLHHRMVKSAAGSGNTAEYAGGGIVDYYENFAKGGVEMVWVEDIVEVFDHFVGASGGGKVDRKLAKLAEIAQAVHKHGGYVGYQLSCMGQKFSGFDPAAATEFATACAEHLTREEIGLLQQDFISGAKYIQSQGFDAVEINAAGNNIGQAFFSRMRNHREDEYGPQSFENRSRFVCEIIRGIKEACGADFPVQVLINGIEENDQSLGNNSLSSTVEENIELCKLMEAAGADSLHVRLGPLGMHVCQFASDLYFTGYGIEGTTGYGNQFDFSRHWQGKLLAKHSGAGMMLQVAKEIKAAVSIPVGTVTYMDPAHAPDFFEEALEGGMADFYLMNRPFNVDPQYVNKLRAGKIQEIVPCTRCMSCHFNLDGSGMPTFFCRVNPCLGRAFNKAPLFEEYFPQDAGVEKRVMVVGGGPAGMEAARVAAERGFAVTLYEKKGILGGLLPFAHAIKGPHENLDRLKAYLANQLQLKGVEVVTGQEVDGEFIKAQAPDVVILAAGGLRDSLGLRATAGTKLISIDEFMFADLGDNITIAGGNLQAVDTALYLLAQGKNVSMVMPDPIEALDKGQSTWVQTFVKPMLFARGCRVWPHAKIAAVGDGEITIAGETGVDITIPCDGVIEALDMLPNTALLEGLGDIESYAVGDCSAPNNIMDAIRTANMAARSI